MPPINCGAVPVRKTDPRPVRVPWLSMSPSMYSVDPSDKCSAAPCCTYSCECAAPAMHTVIKKTKSVFMVSWFICGDAFIFYCFAMGMMIPGHKAGIKRPGIGIVHDDEVDPVNRMDVKLGKFTRED